MDQSQSGVDQKKGLPAWVVPVALVLVGLAVYSMAAKSRQPKAGVADEGGRSGQATLRMPDLDGSTFDLSEHTGKVVMVNLFATWCPPCRAETPDLVRLAESYRSKGLVVVGVSLDSDGPDKVRQFVRDYGIGYPILMPDSSSTTSFQIDGIPIPTTYLLDRQGRVAKKYVGAATEDVFRADVDRLLAEG